MHKWGKKYFVAPGKYQMKTYLFLLLRAELRGRRWQLGRLRRKSSEAEEKQRKKAKIGKRRRWTTSFIGIDSIGKGCWKRSRVKTSGLLITQQVAKNVQSVWAWTHTSQMGAKMNSATSVFRTIDAKKPPFHVLILSKHMFMQKRLMDQLCRRFYSMKSNGCFLKSTRESKGPFIILAPKIYTNCNCWKCTTSMCLQKQNKIHVWLQFLSALQNPDSTYIAFRGWGQ
jgi:hypothetical protein